MAEALVNPHLITWDRERAGFDVAEIARRLKVQPEQFAAWERGEKKPSFSKAQELAQKTRIPFGFLYLKQPPQITQLLPDLRTIGDHEVGTFSLELQDTIRMARERQDWYRDYCLQNEFPALGWPGSCRVSEFGEALVKVQQLLGVGKRPRQFADYYRQLIERMEELGTLVMRNAVVGNNTSRPLDRNEFRGFAIADIHAPLIFINTKDSPQAQLFTLLHEFAHLLLGESGVSDLEHNNPHQTERFCNRLAAEYLVPGHQFADRWDKNTTNWLGELPRLAEYFHVSQWVIARRALEHGYICEAQYWEHYSSILQKQGKEKRSEGGPTYGTMVKLRYGRRFASAVASEALSGRLLLRDAQHLIGVRPGSLKDFSKKELGL